MPKKKPPTRDPKDAEYLLAWISQDLGHTDINIYGNPAGLRRLASMLLRVAEHDQSGDPYPASDSLHCHLSTGLNTSARGALPRLTLGRVESKDGSEAVRYPFPEFDFSKFSHAISDIHI
jgi:hypothetical protein